MQFRHYFGKGDKEQVTQCYIEEDIKRERNIIINFSGAVTENLDLPKFGPRSIFSIVKFGPILRNLILGKDIHQLC